MCFSLLTCHVQYPVSGGCIFKPIVTFEFEF